LSSRDQVYEGIGAGYAAARRPDPRIQRLIVAALGDARSVVNVGAGAGNYEPTDRRVVAVDPSATMIAQRRAEAGPAARAVAEALPFRDQAFDAALATFTLHHWTDVAVGLSELHRVARRQVILLFEPWYSGQFWLVDYFPEWLCLPSELGAPCIDDVREHLDVHTVTRCPCQPTAQMDSPAHIGDAPRPIWIPQSAPGFPAWPCFHPKSLNEASAVWVRTWIPGHGTPVTVTCGRCRRSTWGTGC